MLAGDEWRMNDDCRDGREVNTVAGGAQREVPAACWGLNVFHSVAFILFMRLAKGSPCFIQATVFDLVEGLIYALQNLKIYVKAL